MSGGQAGAAILIALMLILPLSALVARRIPAGRALWMVAAWTAIFAIGYVLFG